MARSLANFCERGFRPGEGRRGRAAGCSFGATEGDGMAASREWCLPGIPRSPYSAEALGDKDECKKEGVPFVCLSLTD